LDHRSIFRDQTNANRYLYDRHDLGLDLGVG
jgi:hypothetical protein